MDTAPAYQSGEARIESSFPQAYAQRFADSCLLDDTAASADGTSSRAVNDQFFAEFGSAAEDGTTDGVDYEVDDNSD